MKNFFGTDYADRRIVVGEMDTLELGKQIIDDFVEACGRKCAGQSTTLSIVDLAEVEATACPYSLSRTPPLLP